jgi:hypothetical protein
MGEIEGSPPISPIFKDFTMIKSSKLGDSVASEMDKILNDPAFKSVFEPVAEDYSQVVNADPTYQAFVRVAKKKEEDEDKEKEDKKDKKDKKKVFPFQKGKKEEKEDKKKDKGKKEDKKEDKKDKKDKKEDKKEDKKDKKEALQYIVNSLITTSEALDNMGLVKSATVALGLLNGIMKEAAEEEGLKFEEDPELVKRIDMLGDEESESEEFEKSEKAPDWAQDLEEEGISDSDLDIDEEEEEEVPELFLADDKKEKKEEDDEDEDEDEDEEEDEKEKEDDEDEDEKDKNDLKFNPFDVFKRKQPVSAPSSIKPVEKVKVAPPVFSGTGVPEGGTAEDWDPLNATLPGGEGALGIGASSKNVNKKALALMAEINEWIKK